jgi:hypothetical protein
MSKLWRQLPRCPKPAQPARSRLVRHSSHPDHRLSHRKHHRQRWEISCAGMWRRRPSKAGQNPSTVSFASTRIYEVTILRLSSPQTGVCGKPCHRLAAACQLWREERQRWPLRGVGRIEKHKRTASPRHRGSSGFSRSDTGASPNNQRCNGRLGEMDKGTPSTRQP